MGAFRKFMLYSVLIAVVGIAGWALFAANFVYSDGFRVGTLMKISKKGNLIKTWEGELNEGGLQPAKSNNNAMSSVWSFSVLDKDENVIGEIDSAVALGSRVKLYYKEMPYQFSWRGDTKYFVYKVEEVPN